MDGVGWRFSKILDEKGTKVFFFSSFMIVSGEKQIFDTVSLEKVSPGTKTVPWWWHGWYPDLAHSSDLLDNNKWVSGQRLFCFKPA